MHDSVVLRAGETVDRKVLHEVVTFHNLTNAFDLESAGVQPVQNACTTDDLKLFEYNSGAMHPGRHSPDPASGGRRPRSAAGFSCSRNIMSRPELEQFLREAFGQSERDGRPIRPYPSAGALYPVNVFVASREEADMFRCMSFDPETNKLANLTKVSARSLLGCFFLDATSSLKPFAFVILYSAFPLAVLAKYHYRGYRHALMECGAMYQNAALLAAERGLSNRVFSGFQDISLARTFGLDPRALWPVVTQLFGYPDEDPL